MEERFAIQLEDMEIPCLLVEPGYGKPRRIVLGVHGMGGSMRDEIQESITEEMELFGSVVLRFDFPGHGENEEDVLSLQGCVDALLAVAEYAKERYPELEDLCVFATDFGAYVTLCAMQELLQLPGRVRMVLHTPVLRMEQTVLDRVEMSQVTLEAMEWAVLQAPRPVGITYSFFEELQQNHAMAAYPIPFLILQGECDDCVPRADIQQFHDLNQQSKLVFIPNVGHSFREGALDMVLDLTRDWFEFEQVLLDYAF
jgi:alpha/beta superfamily hydrolase